MRTELPELADLRCKMVNAVQNGLRYDDGEDSLAFVNTVTRVERAIFIRDGQPYVRTAFIDDDRRVVAPVSTSHACALVEAWGAAIRRLGGHSRA